MFVGKAKQHTSAQVNRLLWPGFPPDHQVSRLRSVVSVRFGDIAPAACTCVCTPLAQIVSRCFDAFVCVPVELTYMRAPRI